MQQSLIFFIEASTTILIVFFNFILILIVFFFTRRKYVDIIAFIIFLICLISWKVTLFLYLSNEFVNYILILGRINFASISLAVYFALLFSISFNQKYKVSDLFNLFKKNFLLSFFTLFTTLIVIVTLFTDLVAKNEIAVGTERITEFGNLYFLFILHFVLTIVLFIYFFLIKLTKNHNRHIRFQIYLILFSFIITSIIGSTTNIILPYFFDIFLFQSIAPVFTLLISLSIAYSIFKYQFLDIKIFIGRIAYYLLVGLVAYLGFYIVLIFNILVFGSPFHPLSFLVGVFNAYIFVVIFNSINKFILNKVNTRLITPDYDPKEEISKFNDMVSPLLDENKIKDLLISTIQRTIKPECISILKNENKNFLSDYRYIFGLMDFVNKNILYLDLLLIYKEDQDSKIESKKYSLYLSKTIKFLQDHKYVLLSLLGDRSTSYGFLCIGQKSQEDSYNTVEINYIQSLSTLSGLAFNRSKLYTEVENFNLSLQEKIKQATKDLEKKNKELEETIALQKDVLDVLGHELRTPLTIARNALSTIIMTEKNPLKKKLTSEQILSFVSSADFHIRREIEMLETILSSARIDNAKLYLEMSVVLIKDIITNTFLAFQDIAIKKGLELQVSLPKDVDMKIYVDRVRIQQIIDNLVSNAIKYTHKGFVKILATQSDKFCYISVIDSGEGIPEDEIPNLGKKFYRINTYLKSKGTLGKNAERKIVRPGGTGLGLYIVFNLTKLMNGEVIVKSKVGEGSTFTLKFPRYLES